AALPSVGQACTCRSPAGVTPPETCCAGSAVCRDPAYPESETGYTCESGTSGPNDCFRTGICVYPTSGSMLPPAPPPSKSCTDTCNPMDGRQSTCDVGYECNLVGQCWACI